jgi:ABC-2 type transport system permease protein
MFGFITKNLENSFILQGNILNGNLFAYLVLKSLWVHFPILVALVTGDLISGEGQSGTLRLILSRPVSRTQLISAKFFAAIIYVSSLVLFMALLSIILGYLVFGTGDLMIILNEVNVFNAEDVPWRLVSAYLFGIVSMSTIAALSVFLSAVTGNSLAAIRGTIALVIVLTFVSLFNIPFLNLIKPFLFTSYTSSWQFFFEYGHQMAFILRDLIILVLHIVLFYLFTLFYFRKKDIVT